MCSIYDLLIDNVCVRCMQYLSFTNNVCAFDGMTCKYNTARSRRPPPFPTPPPRSAWFVMPPRLRNRGGGGAEGRVVSHVCRNGGMEGGEGAVLRKILHMHVLLYVILNVWMHACTLYVCMHACTYVSMCLCMRVLLYVLLYACVYVYIYFFLGMIILPGAVRCSICGSGCSHGSSTSSHRRHSSSKQIKVKNYGIRKMMPDMFCNIFVN